MAQQHPLCCRNRLRLRTYKAFISIAGWLQVLLGKTPVALPCDKLAGILGVSRMTVSRLRQVAEQDRFLILKEKHNHSKHRGTLFMFAVERFPVLQERQ